MNKILLLALALYSGILVASEDNDRHPECPYLLEEGEDCISKSLKEIEKENENKLKKLKEDLRDVYQKDVPEPENLMYLGVSLISLGIYIKKYRG